MKCDIVKYMPKLNFQFQNFKIQFQFQFQFSIAMVTVRAQQKMSTAVSKGKILLQEHYIDPIRPTKTHSPLILYRVYSEEYCTNNYSLKHSLHETPLSDETLFTSRVAGSQSPDKVKPVNRHSSTPHFHHETIQASTRKIS